MSHNFALGIESTHDFLKFIGYPASLFNNRGCHHINKGNPCSGPLHFVNVIYSVCWDSSSLWPLLAVAIVRQWDIQIKTDIGIVFDFFLFIIYTDQNYKLLLCTNVVLCIFYVFLFLYLLQSLSIFLFLCCAMT